MKNLFWFEILIFLLLSCDPCRNKNCVNGECIEGDCECYDGWTGDNCEIDLCAGSCINGDCIDGNCECSKGWTGASCNIELCGTGSCVHGYCSNNECVCDVGWTGEFCTLMSDPCDGINCMHGTCINGICDCDPNWEGTLCDVMIDPCYQVDCSENGYCNELIGECICDEGWTGDDCSITEGNELCTNTCTWHDDGECDDGGPDSDFSLCECGTDCNDCGLRSEADCSGGNSDAAIAIWTSMVTFPCNTQQIDIYIDGNYEGYLDSYFISVPDCNDAGTVTVEVISGSHDVYAECNDGDTYWGPGTITVDPGSCLLLELTEKKNLLPGLTKYSKK